MRLDILLTKDKVNQVSESVIPIATRISNGDKETFLGNVIPVKLSKGMIIHRFTQNKAANTLGAFWIDDQTFRSIMKAVVAQKTWGHEFRNAKSTSEVIRNQLALCEDWGVAINHRIKMELKTDVYAYIGYIKPQTISKALLNMSNKRKRSIPFNVDRLRGGPAEFVHIVKRGETLQKLVKRYNLSGVSEIKQLKSNKRYSNVTGVLKAGSNVFIPNNSLTKLIERRSGTNQINKNHFMTNSGQQNVQIYIPDFHRKNNIPTKKNPFSDNPLSEAI